MKQHAAYSILPSQVDVWVSELSFKSDSNYLESKPSMLFISIPGFFFFFLCQCTISVLTSLRMCYEMISYLTQRTRHQKKRKKKKNPPTLLLCNSSLVSEVFKNDFFSFARWRGGERHVCFVPARFACLHACTCV